MKKYKFEIKFDNNNGGKSTAYFSCKAKNEKEARKQLAQWIVNTEYLGAEITVKLN